MTVESPRTPSAAMLQYLSKHKSEAEEILRLIELYKPRWEERRKDDSTASHDGEIIQILRHRLSELAQGAKAQLEQSLLKFERLRREIEQEKEKRLALFADKMRPLSEGIKTLDGLLAAPATKAATKTYATAAQKPTAAKTGTAASKKPSASTAKRKKASGGSAVKSQRRKAKSSSKAATKSATKAAAPSEAKPAANEQKKSEG